jgi:hypothetical protein
VVVALSDAGVTDADSAALPGDALREGVVN